MNQGVHVSWEQNKMKLNLTFDHFALPFRGIVFSTLSFGRTTRGTSYVSYTLEINTFVTARARHHLFELDPHHYYQYNGGSVKTQTPQVCDLFISSRSIWTYLGPSILTYHYSDP